LYTVALPSLPHPTTSPLFPYTTLFRSHRVHAVDADLVRAELGGHRLRHEDDRALRAVVDGEPRPRPHPGGGGDVYDRATAAAPRSEEHTSELQSPYDLVCRLLLEKKKK